MDRKVAIALVLLVAATAGGCTSEPATHFITGQLIAELARDEP